MFVDIKNVHDRMFANIRNTYLEKVRKLSTTEKTVFPLLFYHSLI